MGTWSTLFPVDKPAITLSTPDNNPFTFEGQVSGYLSTSNYNDTYPIYLQKGYKYDFITVNDGTGTGSKGTGLYGLWTDILIYDGNGDLLKLNRTFSSETIGYNGDIFDFEVSTSGTYYVSESMNLTTDSGYYYLAINIDPPTTTTSTVTTTPVTTTTTTTPTTTTTTATTTTTSSGSSAVYRFYNTSNGTHFYTASATERDSLRSSAQNMSYEGAVFGAPTSSSTATSVYRFYNKNNGSHFFTISQTERDSIINTMSNTYTYEGAAYNAYTSAVGPTVSGATPLYRFYNNAQGTHFFTASSAERDNIINTMSGTYKYEGTAFYVLSSSGAGAQADPEQSPLSQAMTAYAGPSDLSGGGESNASPNRQYQGILAAA